MAVVDTLYFILKGDTVNLDNSVKKAKDNTRSLNRELARTDQLSSEAGKQLSNLLKATLSIGAIVAGTRAILEYSENLYSVSNSLKVNIETLGAWSAAAKNAGGTAEGFQQSLKKISEALNLSPEETLSKLPELSDRFKNLSFQQSQKLGSELGIDEKTIELLRLGSEELEKIITYQKQLGSVTEEDAKIIHQFNLEWDNTLHGFKALGTQVFGILLPGFSEILKFIQTSVIDLRRYPHLIDGLTYAFSGLAVVLGVLSIRAIAAFLPISKTIILATALAASIGLLYDDIKVFSEGGDSALGILIDKFPILNTAIEKTITVIKDLARVWDAFVGNTDESFSDIISDIRNRDSFVGAPEETAEQAYNRILKSGGDFTEFDKKHNPGLQERQNSISDFFSRNDNTQKLLAKYLQDVNNAPVNYSPYGPRSPSSNSQAITTNIDTLTINTSATNTSEIAETFVEEVNKQQNRQALSNYDDGVAR